MMVAGRGKTVKTNQATNWWFNFMAAIVNKACTSTRPQIEKVMLAIKSILVIMTTSDEDILQPALILVMRRVRVEYTDKIITSVKVSSSTAKQIEMRSTWDIDILDLVAGPREVYHTSARWRVPPDAPKGWGWCAPPRAWVMLLTGTSYEVWDCLYHRRPLSLIKLQEV